VNLSFRSEADMEKAVTVLQGYTWKNKEMKVKVESDFVTVRRVF